MVALALALISLLAVASSVSAAASIDLQIPLSKTSSPAANLATSTTSRTSLPPPAGAATPPPALLRHGGRRRLLVFRSPSYPGRPPQTLAPFGSRRQPPPAAILRRAASTLPLSAIQAVGKPGRPAAFLVVAAALPLLASLAAPLLTAAAQTRPSRGRASCSASTTQRSSGLLPSRLLDLAPSAELGTSGSAEWEVDKLCRSLGLLGPQEFAIPIAVWEARKSRSNSELLQRMMMRPVQPQKPCLSSHQMASSAGYFQYKLLIAGDFKLGASSED
ncbi:hypothetical protein C2845_PM11G06020 [Panicum miliaceum]|uniref:Uncharacterized protein n=1 Tax=Panicum miliaceum TaxID=4540 RepID=A0A3L6RS70_PANMI|nr:hypothetical protein C2845_PM11G06020 [Panicum miliaceum]